MPELAEVEYFRKEWNQGLGGLVKDVALHQRTRLFRGCDFRALENSLPGTRFVRSEAHGKRLLFQFQNESDAALLWLGLHLGMTGKLFCAPVSYEPAKHDHLVLYQKDAALVFSDYRQFGRVDFSAGDDTPSWWSGLPPPILSSQFTRERLEEFVGRHRRTSIKGVLLMQECFPGLGNWMVDEILWQAGLRPARPAGSLTAEERRRLFRFVRSVCRTAMNTVGRDYSDPPKGWLFHQRWKKGGVCPRTGSPLIYEKIAGRTTCWSSKVQK